MGIQLNPDLLSKLLLPFILVTTEATALVEKSVVFVVSHLHRQTSLLLPIPKIDKYKAFLKSNPHVIDHRPQSTTTKSV